MFAFEWDAKKANGNLRKHGVEFEIAALVFSDPHLMTELSDDGDGERWRTVGTPARRGADPHHFGPPGHKSREEAL